jgi:hypothetical protein
MWKCVLNTTPLLRRAARKDGAVDTASHPVTGALAIRSVFAGDYVARSRATIIIQRERVTESSAQLRSPRQHRVIETRENESK